ncbi:hypothetical protein FGO68_gene1964 [Halteria grandinella]|uniref:Uncharacterized protein n=1 Tax=Halteria grandinella TaxID=5974 RepID=A0A8J8NMB2_HALGN|nr:hypothetical protein FGO68_gene1964 [Halteria grandinella]
MTVQFGQMAHVERFHCLILTPRLVVEQEKSKVIMLRGNKFEIRTLGQRFPKQHVQLVVYPEIDGSVRIIIFGGTSKGADDEPCFETYQMILPKDFETNTDQQAYRWIDFAPTATFRFECTGCILNDRLYIFGNFKMDMHQLTCDRIDLSRLDSQFEVLKIKAPLGAIKCIVFCHPLSTVTEDEHQREQIIIFNSRDDQVKKPIVLQINDSTYQLLAIPGQNLDTLPSDPGKRSIFQKRSYLKYKRSYIFKNLRDDLYFVNEQYDLRISSIKI